MQQAKVTRREVAAARQAPRWCRIRQMALNWPA